MKIKSDKVMNGRVKLTKDVEANPEVIGEEMVEQIKNFRRRNGDGVDLSVYEVEVKNK